MNVGRNVIHGLLGFLGPAIVVVASYPVLVRHLGVAAFGVYLLALSLSGTVMLLDLGFCTATLKFVAEDLAASRPRAAANVIVTSLVAYAGMGVVGGALVAISAPLLAGLFQVDGRLAADAVLTFRLAALQFTALLPATVFVAVAKGFEQFDRAAWFVLLLALATYGGAMVAVLAGAGLVGAMLATVLANLAAVLLIIVAGWRLCRSRGIELSRGRPVAFRRGLWMDPDFEFPGRIHALSSPEVRSRSRPGACCGYGVSGRWRHAVENARCRECRHRSDVPVFERFAGSRIAAAGLSPDAGRERAGGACGLCRASGSGAPSAGYLAGWPAGGFGFAPASDLCTSLLFPGSLACAVSPGEWHRTAGPEHSVLHDEFLNIAFILAASVNGMTLAKVAWAFAAANILTSVGYQIAVEMLVWRREPRLLEAQA